MAVRTSFAFTLPTIKAAQPGDKRIELWDRELPGFGVRIEPSGVKTFFVKYRADGGGRSAAQRKMTIGRFGPLTLDQARKQARTILGGAATGSDPAAELQAKRREMKVSELIDLYEDEGCFIQRGKRQGQPMKSTTKKNTLARLRNHVVPLLGNKRANDLNAGDMEKFVADVTAGKTARDEILGPRKRLIVTGGAGGATKVFCDLSAVFSFALRREIIIRNPCATAAVRRTGNNNDRYLTFEELTRLGKALDALEQDEGVNRKAIDIARLWALTGCRNEEIAALKWAEVDLEDGFLLLDDSKTGKSRRPLGMAAVTLLSNLAKERTGKSPYVFPAERGEAHYQGAWRYWDKAVAAAELPGVTPHTLRHTMGSTATSTGEALALTGAILGHANPRSTAIYAHVQADPSKRAANRVTKKIAAALSGETSGGRRTRKKVQPAASDNTLIRTLEERIAAGGEDADRIRAVLAEAIVSTPQSAIAAE